MTQWFFSYDKNAFFNYQKLIITKMLLKIMTKMFFNIDKHVVADTVANPS